MGSFRLNFAYTAPLSNMYRNFRHGFKSSCFDPRSRKISSEYKAICMKDGYAVWRSFVSGVVAVAAVF